MPSSTDELDATGLRDAQWFARRLRERAQERIVHSFRAQIEGGPEPADEDLAIFAKLAAEEHRLGLRQAVPSAKPERPAPKAGARHLWLATLRARLGRAQSAAASATRALRPTPDAIAAIGPWLTVIGSAAAVCLLFGGFALWYPLFVAAPAPLTAAMRQATPDVPIAVASAPAGVTPVVSLPAAKLVELDLIDESKAQPTTAAAGPPVAVPAPRIGRAPPQAKAEPPARPVAVAHQRTADPLASCRPLNFFARAVCLNDTCARRQFARHPACGSVLAQRRVDEARRNPTMLN